MRLENGPRVRGMEEDSIWQGILHPNSNAFIAVICTDCGYTEFYLDKPESARPPPPGKPWIR